MRLRLSAMAGSVVGLALAAAACGTTSDVNSSPGAASTGAAAAPGFGTANQKLCASKAVTKPGYQNTIGTVQGGASRLSGAGATFVAPVMSAWTKSYNSASGVQVSYQSIGSDGGIAQIQAQTVDFGASDTGMTPAEIRAAKGGTILQIPLLLGAVVPAYNVPGVGSGLKFTGNVLGEIFAGKITRWNDPAIKSLNQGVDLPNQPIAVVHRSDGSGTTGIWTDYLTKVSPAWVSELGGPSRSAGQTVAWPTGIGGKGNEGVSAAVGQTRGSLGYVTAEYAVAQRLSYGQVQNRSGKFIQPCVPSITPAVEGVSFPSSLNTSLTNGSNPDVYPITGTSYALVYKNHASKATAAGLVSFFAWALTKGQGMTADLTYAPLGKDLQKLSYGQLKMITLNGQQLAG
jgi:phosphate transport system substrate-binding protein